jgi:ryanodine receptor 2
LVKFNSEREKTRRWEEIRLRQHRILAEVEHTTPAHIDHIMKSGFTMNDIKTMTQRNYDQDAGESDEVLRPARPTRRTSVSRQNGNYSDNPTLEVNGRMQRSTSELNMNNYENDEKDDKKKRGRSPFRLFGKKRDQSKDKIKAKNEADADKRHQGRNVIQSNLMTRNNPTVRVSNVS